MNVLQRIHEIHELPTLPEILFKVQDLVNSEEGDAAMLARIIEQDPSLTTKILKVANSSYFGPANQKVSSLPLAVARVGFNEVRNIVTAISLIKQFSKKSSLLDYRAFWRHSLSAAYLTQKIAMVSCTDISPEDRQFSFVAGLLHDIGILMYDQFFHKEFEEIKLYGMMHEKSFLVAEQAVAGKESHPMLGAALLEIWKIDLPVISGVRFHHQGWEKAPGLNRTVAGITCLAEYILCNCALGSFEGSYTDVDEEILKCFGTGADTMAELFSSAEAQVDKSDLIVAMGMGSGKGQLRRI
jgi:HD-like signal output (HDOD) protein